MSIVEDRKKLGEDGDELEISFNHIVAFFKGSLFTVLRWSFGFAIIGAVYAFLQPNQYVAEVKVMPELQNKSGNNLGGISSLAGLAGISVDGLSSGADAIRPDLYPTILKSVPFGLYMLQKPVKASSQAKPVSLEAYISAMNSKTLFSFLSGNKVGNETIATENELVPGMLVLNHQQEAIVGDVLERVSGDIDKKSGILTVSAKMLSPEVAAQTAKYALDYLTAYVTNYRTSKSRQQVRFLQQQFAQSQKRYQAAEYALSSYRDSNRSLYLNTAKLDEQRLQADFLLTQGLYNDLAKQLEQAKIKVQEESPVFQTLEPARVPLTKSGPKRTLIVFGSLVFGAVVGLMFYFVRHFLIPQKE